MSDLVIVSKHEKGFWQADFYKDGGEIPSVEWEAIGAVPDDYFTMSQSMKDVMQRAGEKWPDAVIVRGGDQ
jgi:hypothetical protein